MKSLVWSTLAFFVLWAPASAIGGGTLNFYNWGDYTNPELLKKFTLETGIQVKLDNYESNEMMLAKLKAGGHGYDLAVPSHFMIQVMVKEGLLRKIDTGKLSNFRNVRPEHVNVNFDPGRQYSIPWHWGTTGISLNTQYYNGPKTDSWALLFDPPDKLKGKINMLPEMTAVINAALFYLGLPLCNSSQADLRRVDDLLKKSKPLWATIDYGVIEKMTSGDVFASHNYNGASMRIRLQAPSVKYIYPKEGLDGWSDNVVLLADAGNLKESYRFLNFIMAPENAALNSNYVRYANAIAGSEKYMDEKMATSPEITGPKDPARMIFTRQCSQEVNTMYTRIWNNLLK